MSDNSAGSPANTEPGPEVAVPDQASQSQISIKEAVSSEDVSDKTESLAHMAPAGDETAPTHIDTLAPPVPAAARQAAVRPRIGDTRPAPPAPGHPEPAEPALPIVGADDVVGLQTPAKTRPAGQGQRRQSGRQSSAKQGQQVPRDAGSKTSAPTTDLDGGDDEILAGGGESVLTASATKGRRRSGRERRGKPVGRYLMCVHVRPHATQIAVLEGRTLVEHFVSRASDDTSQIDGNIYLGRVQNVLPGMEAAFVDIATPKNAVLYRGDVRYDLEDIETRSSSALRIEQMLKPGQMIVCQVTKNPIGAKGARLTQEVSLPGRFVVMVPNSSAFGISKRLEDPERRRLRRVVDEIRPEGHGLIVRTAARGASLDELRHDVARLSAQWAVIESEASRTTTPKLLYREPDLGVRIVREELNNDYRAVIIDDQDLYEQVRDYVAGVNPELVERIEHYDTQVEPLPLFERYHVHEQLHKALDRKVWLPSGGSIIIERTEALTVIDVNTGKNVGTSNLEETVFRNNLEAAEEIARQLRLRDIGGIIVIDFIDMEIRENRDKVGSSLRSALARDKTRTQVYEISDLGLVEMTRKRVSEGLVESLSTTCTVCGGRGIMLDESLL
jgi:ribonuclease E